MCGIVGYVGNGNTTDVLLESLLRLEYRGYDSAGIALVSDGNLRVIKSYGRIFNLKNKMPDTILASAGIGHTRWATHGKPSEVNAHPHKDCTGKIAVVHNGIIENYIELREMLIARGHKFLSETDTEVVSHLIEENYTGDTCRALQETIKQLKEVERRRIKDYCEYHKGARYTPNGNIWDIPCDVAFPSATENEITGKDAKKLVKNGCIAVGEGANMPTTPEGVHVFIQAGIAYGPGKAANAGGVATSGLEMQQNAGREAWGFEETDAKLRQIMRNVFTLCSEAAEEFGSPGNMVVGANIAGFIKVARAMISHGIV
jgi:hypothetical protein